MSDMDVMFNVKIKLILKALVTHSRRIKPVVNNFKLYHEQLLLSLKFMEHQFNFLPI